MAKRKQMDQILMKNMKFFSYVGVLQEEKVNGQMFEVDLTLYFDRLKACDTDLLSQTTDYGEVYKRVEKMMTSASFDLIEKLAGYLADQLLAHFRLIDGLEVSIRKPQAPVEGSFDYMGVTIYRERG